MYGILGTRSVLIVVSLPRNIYYYLDIFVIEDSTDKNFEIILSNLHYCALLLKLFSLWVKISIYVIIYYTKLFTNNYQ